MNNPTELERLRRIVRGIHINGGVYDITDYESDAIVRAILEALKEPSQNMKIAGVLALTEIMEKEEQYWEEPERQNEVTARGTKVMPTWALALVGSKDTDAVFQAYLDAILSEEPE